MAKHPDDQLINKSENILLAFYQGKHPDSKGRMIEDIWSWNYQKIEEKHDYIQWLFPLKEKSRFNPDAPVLDDEVVQAFKTNYQLRNRLIKSLKVMLGFYGLQCNEYSNTDIEIFKSNEYSERRHTWVNLLNHNYLRLTRILTTLKTLGLVEYAQALFKCLDQIYKEESRSIGKETYVYWKNALL